MGELLLSVNDLWVSYVTDAVANKAVNGISFNLYKGETLGFVGETGAGKTTSALSLLRLLPRGVGRVDKGSAVFDGKDLLKVSEAEMRAIRGGRISMIFQDPMTSLNPVLTVGEQIAEALGYHSDNKDKQAVDLKVDELLNMVGIPASRKKEYPHQFSGGMKQRVVIAIALSCSPELLIADEPTTALDVTIQAQVLEMMESLKKRLHTSMILITHDLGIVAQTCDKVGILYSGEIVEYGSVYDIFEGDRHHPYTQGLFGSIPDLTHITRRLNPIKGQMTDPSNLPQGCKFNPRCEFSKDECRAGSPPAYEVNPGHTIKCVMFGETDKRNSHEKAPRKGGKHERKS